jgi:phthiocerol/phenolphthiocerol synthesis type-I polyketide synthase E
LSEQNTHELDGIAIIGMAGRFPGANNTDQLFENLKNGVETISTFSDEELKTSGVPESLIQNPAYIKRSGVIENPEYFDAPFFGYSPREAEYIDPQQRIFLECAWHAFEDAGYDPERTEQIVGVYAGCGINNYLLKNLLSHSDWMESIVDFLTFSSNEKDFLSTRVSYKMNLTGPSLTIQTACSTSLAAVQIACQSLLTYQCDMALAGGISISTPRMKGYLFTEGQILSKEGICRAFDKRASGTIFGEGVGIVLLKRLEDAIADNDSIYAVIRSVATNNDGSDKVGYAAPSVNGQAAVISTAHALAEINVEDIAYVEAHGTGTKLGDPIEVAALKLAFQEATNKKNFCALGSIKPNIGHFDTAAGIAGLIKIALMLKNRKIPPLINFKEANPELHLESSPFYINTELLDWDSPNKPRIAALSSFGIGGTNVHCIVQEAPFQDFQPSQQNCHLLPISAKNKDALKDLETSLSRHMPGDIRINDASFTLQQGRSHFDYRKVIICRNKDEVKEIIDQNDIKRMVSGQNDTTREVIFMFSGQGSQYCGMGQDLYKNEPVFQDAVNRCAAIIQEKANFDLLSTLYPSNDTSEPEILDIYQTAFTQPALFTIEYAMAKLLEFYGIKADSFIGHSIGEYTAACLSGVFSLEDSLDLVISRGRLMQNQPTGSMLSIALGADELRPLLIEGTEISVINAPQLSVVSGTEKKIEEFESVIRGYEKQKNKKIRTTILKTSHAFHSYQMDGAVVPFIERFKSKILKGPSIPFISNVSGTWITDDEAKSPEYWGKQLRKPVRFSDGILKLMENPQKILIEVGPGSTLTILANYHVEEPVKTKVISTMRRQDQIEDDVVRFYFALGQCFCNGTNLNWKAFYRGENPRRISMPLYPFQRQRYWIERTDNPSESKTDGQREKKALTDERQSKNRDRKNGQTFSSLEEVTKELSIIWQRVLGIKHFSSDDNFYNLGGHSVLAAQLFAEIESHFSMNIPLSTLYSAPTVAQLSKILFEQSGDVKWSCLVPVQPNGTQRPLFLIHGAEGNVLLYRKLAHYLGDDQPLYGLQAAALDGRKEINADFKSVASEYLREIQTVQPHGPYLLGGYCLGGTIALELAQQLKAKGEEVDLVAMIEIYNVKTMTWPQPLMLRVYNDFLNLIFHFRNLMAAEKNSKLDFFTDKFTVQLNRMKVSFKIGLARLFRALNKKEAKLKYHHIRIDKAFDHALEQYDPYPYEGRIDMFVSKYRYAGFSDTLYGFGHIALNGVFVHEIDCYPRGTLTEPYVKELADTINKTIKEIGSKQKGSSKSLKQKRIANY